MWENYVLPNHALGRLIGRVGTTGSWFSIGEYLNYVPVADGRLYLMFNDLPDSFADNVGEMPIRIQVC